MPHKDRRVLPPDDGGSETQQTGEKLVTLADTGQLTAIKELLGKPQDGVSRNGIPVKFLTNFLFPYKKQKCLQYFNPGTTPLMAAARAGHLDICQTLVDDYQAQVDTQDAEYWLALHYACFSGHYDVADFLLSKNSPTNVISMYEKATPVGFAQHRRFEQCVKVFAQRDPTVPATVPPLSEKERADVWGRVVNKWTRGAGSAFLNRYTIDPKIQEWVFNNFHKAGNDIVFPATDVLFGAVMLRMTMKHPEHLAQRDELKKLGLEIVRASSCSTLQHILVVNMSSAEDLGLVKKTWPIGELAFAPGLEA